MPMSGPPASDDPGTPVFRPGVDLRADLGQLLAKGAVHVAGALAQRFLGELVEELSHAEYAPVPPAVGQVRQQSAAVSMSAPFDGWPLLQELVTAVVSAVTLGPPLIPSLDDWRPNEAYIQRYEQGSVGITPHRDSKAQSLLMAVLTVEGSARFSICSDRAGTTIAEWSVGPGDLILLRGAGLAGEEDGRPLHAVSGPVSGSRVSVLISMQRSTPTLVHPETITAPPPEA